MPSDLHARFDDVELLRDRCISVVAATDCHVGFRMQYVDNVQYMIHHKPRSVKQHICHSIGDTS